MRIILLLEWLPFSKKKKINLKIKKKFNYISAWREQEIICGILLKLWEKKDCRIEMKMRMKKQKISFSVLAKVEIKFSETIKRIKLLPRANNIVTTRVSSCVRVVSI